MSCMLFYIFDRLSLTSGLRIRRTFDVCSTQSSDNHSFSVRRLPVMGLYTSELKPSQQEPQCVCNVINTYTCTYITC